MRQFFLLVLTILLFVYSQVCAQQDAKPNIVIIYGDDVGYGDVGIYGSTLIPTPHIDKLAREGLLFTDGHCSAATCTPSRYSLLTGIYAFRDGISILPPNAPLCISTKILTLPKLFQRAGYSTSVIGKWHLGIGEKNSPMNWNGDVKPGPLEIGFESSYILPSTNDRVPCVYLDGHSVVNLDANDRLYVSRILSDVSKPGSTAYPDGKTNREAMTYYKSSLNHNNSIINGIGRMGYMSGGKSALWDDETMTDEFVKKAKEYISDHKETPFFLYFASQDIHVPRTPHPRFKGKTKLGPRGDAMVAFDWATGEILAALEEHGLAENTIVIFSSDNGPVYDDGYYDGTKVNTSSKEIDRGHDASGIWRGGKYQIYEGGTRVPFIVSWPNHIKPGISDALVSQIDLLASFAHLLGLDIIDNETCDSRNTLDAFLGNDKIGLSCMIEEAPRRIALRNANWKFIKAGKQKGTRGAPPEAALFNLKVDPSEQNNILQEYPNVAEKMKHLVDEIIVADGIRKWKTIKKDEKF